MKENVKKIWIIILGELLCAFAITFFFIPNKLLSGGVGGIAIMLEYLTGYSSGVFIFLINIPLLVFGFKKLSKKFMVFTFLSANLLSLYLMIFKAFNVSFIIKDIMLSAIFGGVINGIGMGLLFRYGASQGGLDIIAIIARKEFNMNISSALMIMNMIVISIASILFGLEKGMYTIISLYVGYQLVDLVVSGFDDQKQLFIISEKAIEIANMIMVDPHRGVTLFQARGAYTGHKKEVLYVVANNRQIVRIKKVVNDIDPKAFISISDMVEVKGKGFKHKDY